MSLINNDIKLIPNKRFNVPQIDRDIFIEGIMNYLKSFQPEDDYNYSFAEMQDALTFDGEMNLTNEINLFFTDKVNIDTENASVTAKECNTPVLNSIIGVHELNNGFVFWGVLVGGDWEEPAIKIIYFDGKEFQSYTPSYGNCINLNIDCAFGNYEDEDEDYLNQYNLNFNDLCNLDISQKIDASMIIQELQTVFQLTQTYNGNQIFPQNNNPKTNSTSNTAQTQKKNTITDVLLQVFESKKFALIPPLQQSLLNQGFKTYDKNLCWKNLKDKDVMLKDIYNYILQFDNNANYSYKFVECNKIITYIKKYKYRFEGYLYN